MKFKGKIRVGSALVAGGLCSTGLGHQGVRSRCHERRLAAESGGEGRPRLICAPAQPHRLSSSTCSRSWSRWDQRGMVTQPNSSPQWKNPVTCPPGSGSFCIWKGSKPHCFEGPFVFHLLETRIKTRKHESTTGGHLGLTVQGKSRGPGTTCNSGSRLNGRSPLPSSWLPLQLYQRA